MTIGVPSCVVLPPPPSVCRPRTFEATTRRARQTTTIQEDVVVVRHRRCLLPRRCAKNSPIRRTMRFLRYDAGAPSIPLHCRRCRHIDAGRSHSHDSTTPSVCREAKQKDDDDLGAHNGPPPLGRSRKARDTTHPPTPPPPNRPGNVIVCEIASSPVRHCVFVNCCVGQAI